MKHAFRLSLIILIAGVVGFLWSQLLPPIMGVIASIVSGAFIGHNGYNYLCKDDAS